MKFLALLAALASMLLAPTALAESMELEYKRFYSHVRKLQSDDTSALQFAFGFKHIDSGELCRITSAYIHTQKQAIPLQVSPEFRFTVPSERALKLADAKVRIDLDAPLNKCDLSVQLETKADFLKRQYSKHELNFLLQQYEAFFDEMGSFLSFLMPSVKGLTVHFKDSQQDTPLHSGLSVEQGLLNLDKDWINQSNQLDLPAKPLRITALAE